jgi:hypothetical protein
MDNCSIAHKHPEAPVTLLFIHTQSVPGGMINILEGHCIGHRSW